MRPGKLSPGEEDKLIFEPGIFRLEEFKYFRLKAMSMVTDEVELSDYVFQDLKILAATAENIFRKVQTQPTE